MSTDGLYPIGTPGQPWAADERAQWLAMQRRQRSYADDVVRVIDTLRDRFDVVEYGGLDYGDQHFVLYALRSVDWDAALPIALVTGGVHGYETSGVQGALLFLRSEALKYAQVNRITPLSFLCCMKPDAACFVFVPRRSTSRSCRACVPGATKPCNAGLQKPLIRTDFSSQAAGPFSASHFGDSRGSSDTRSAAAKRPPSS
jgi:hypothetical protein